MVSTWICGTAAAGSNLAGFGGAGAGRFLRADFGVPTVLELGVEAFELVFMVSEEGNSSLTGAGGKGALRDFRDLMVPPAERLRELFDDLISELRKRLLLLLLLLLGVVAEML